MELGLFALGCFVLFLIIALAVKIAVKEALHEFKKEIISEFNLEKILKLDKERED